MTAVQSVYQKQNNHDRNGIYFMGFYLGFPG